MTKVFVRAIGIFGRYDRSNSAWDDDYKGVFESQVRDYSYPRIEQFLKEHGKGVIDQQINMLPYIGDGIITGPDAISLYFLNNCLVANLFVSGNGFNFDGVIQTLLSAGLSEQEIEKNFNILKAEVSGYVSSNEWFNNSKLKKDVDIPNVPKELGKNIEALLQSEPKLLGLLS